MKLFIFVMFLASSIAMCGPNRELVDFETACAGAPNRKVAVEGFIQDGNPACSANTDSRDCTFWLTDSSKGKAILFTLTEGTAANQVELPKADSSSKPTIQVRGASGKILDLTKPIVLSGKTTVLVSSSTAPICKLDNAEVSQ